MILLSADKVSKSFSEKVLLKDVSLFLSDTDKVGVIGINGTGKTTLLNLLAGRISPDQGTISKASGARIAYLRQNPVFDENLSLLSIVLQNIDPQTGACYNFGQDGKIDTENNGGQDHVRNTSEVRRRVQKERGEVEPRQSQERQAGSGGLGDQRESAVRLAEKVHGRGRQDEMGNA